jgi:hypothetical protein
LIFPRNTTNGDRWPIGKRYFELVCFQRWFILAEFMRAEGIPLVFYGDADTLLFSDVNEIYNKYFQSYSFVPFAVEPLLVNFSFAFLGLDALVDVVGFFTQLYRQWQTVFPSGLTGANFNIYANDMFAVKLYAARSTPVDMLHCAARGMRKGDLRCKNLMDYTFSERVAYTPKYPFKSLATVGDDGVFDFSLSHHLYTIFESIAVNNATLYMDFFKKITWIDGRPYLREVGNTTYPSKYYYAHGLHFQFKKKMLMPTFVRNYHDCPRHLRPCTCTTLDCTECLSDCDRIMLNQLLQELR